MVVVLSHHQGKEAAMFRASIGGRDAARVAVYRHSLVRLVIPLLVPLAAGPGWSPLTLALGAILMSWDPGPTLAQRFASALTVLDAALPRRRRAGRTYQGFVKALARRGEGVLMTLGALLRGLSERAAGAAWRSGEFVPIAADGSKFDAPRTIANEALGVAGKDKCGPQMTTLLLVHLGVMLPWAWKIGHAADPERSLLRGLLDLLPARTLLVADAGFTGFDLLSELARRKVSFLIRVGRGVRLLRELGYYRHEGQGTVYLWPDSMQSRPPLVLRLIRVGDVWLITDVTDPRRLSARSAAELYRRRWGVEVAFRTLKQTLERRKVRSGQAVNARAELGWSIAGLWVLGLLGVDALRSARIPARRLSFASALAAVRHAAHRPRSTRELRGRLRRAVVDRCRRRGSKKAYRWPHKKRCSPPGAPNVTTATRAQVKTARSLRTDPRHG
jgi:hypothetical protein